MLRSAVTIVVGCGNIATALPGGGKITRAIIIAIQGTVTIVIGTSDMATALACCFVCRIVGALVVAIQGTIANATAAVAGGVLG